MQPVDDTDLDEGTMRILHLDTSISGQASVSRILSAEAVNCLLARYPRATLAYRDLAANPIPHLSGNKNAEDSSLLQIDEGAPVLQQFLEADVIVIGVAFYNLSIPSQLKAWIDRIVVSGQTFRYGPRGVEGLAAGKRIILLIARGGVYSEGNSLAPTEHAESYLKSIFAFIGAADVEVIAAEGLAMGETGRHLAISSASEKIREQLIGTPRNVILAGE